MTRTVKQVVAELASGKIPLHEAVDDFQFRSWTPRPPVSKEAAAGVEDFGPPDDNSIDWVDLNPDLTSAQRAHLLRTYDKAMG